ncbi:monocarboxylate transporter 7-like [Asterias amurensis]|uniref:monocarboxylate transporter 7-like n=1 Tax=Asterias amurensis TaxID=7602 RepID=UPI003AB1C74E
MNLRLESSWGWVVTFCGALHLMVCYSILNSFVLVYIEIQRQFNTSASAVAWIPSLAWFFFSIPSPLIVKLCDRFTHTSVSFVGVITSSVALFGSTFATSLWVIYLTYGVIFAVGCSTFHAPVYGLIVAYFVKRFNILTTAMIGIANTISLMAIIPLVTLALESIGWRWMYRVMAGTMLLIGIPCSFTYKPPEQSQNIPREDGVQAGYKNIKDGETTTDEKEQVEAIQLKQYSELGNLEDESFKEGASNTQELEPLPKDVEVTCETETMRSPLGRIIITPGFWMYMTAATCCSISMTFNVISLGNYLIQEGLTTEEASVKISILGVCELVGRILTAALGDHLPIRQINVLMICCVIGTSMSFVIGLWPSAPVITVYAIVAGSLRGVVHSIMVPCALSALHRPGCSTIVSSAIASFGIGSLLTAACSDLPFDLTGSYTTSHYIGACLWFIAAIQCGMLSLCPCVLQGRRCVLASTSRYQKPEIDAV